MKCISLVLLTLFQAHAGLAGGLTGNSKEDGGLTGNSKTVRENAMMAYATLPTAAIDCANALGSCAKNSADGDLLAAIREALAQSDPVNAPRRFRFVRGKSMPGFFDPAQGTGLVRTAPMPGAAIYFNLDALESASDPQLRETPALSAELVRALGAQAGVRDGAALRRLSLQVGRELLRSSFRVALPASAALPGGLELRAQNFPHVALLSNAYVAAGDQVLSLNAALRSLSKCESGERFTGWSLTSGYWAPPAVPAHKLRFLGTLSVQCQAGTLRREVIEAVRLDFANEAGTWSVTPEAVER